MSSIESLESINFNDFKTAILNQQYSYEIDLACVKKASKVNKYLIQHKMLLSGMVENFESENVEQNSLSATSFITPIQNRKKLSEKNQTSNSSLENTILLTAGKYLGVIFSICKLN